MPLIIIVLIIIVLISWGVGIGKDSERKRKQYKASSRKTNAKMEREVVDKYMKYGKPFNEAFELAQKEMIKNGFEPCIPRDAYKPDLWSSSDGTPPETSECPECEKYDSDAIKHLRTEYYILCDKRKEKRTREGEDKYIYGDKLPQTARQYETFLMACQYRGIYDAASVGSYISYSGLGTCEVIDLDVNTSEHIVKVIRTGEIKRISFGDKNITKL